MPLNLDAIYRCDWVRENNGVIQSIWVPLIDNPHDAFPILINSTRAQGTPKVGETISLSVGTN